MPASLRLLALGLLAASTLGLTDCKKSSEPEPVKPSARELLLTTPKWRVSGFAEEETTAAGVVTTTDIPLATFDPCSMDDFEYYHADKKFEVDEGTMKCSAIYPNIALSGTWSLEANETELLLKYDPSGSYSRRIRTLTATTLSLASPPTARNGVTLVQITTYSAY